MPETIIESVLTGKLTLEVLTKWLNVDSNEDASDDCELLCCSRSEFVASFLTFLRNQTDSILKPKGTHCQHSNTPEKILNSRRKHKRSVSEPNSEVDDSLIVRNEHLRSASPKKKSGRRVKTKLFNDSKEGHSISSDESRINTSIDRLVISSTPLKNGRPDSTNSSPVTPLSRNSSYCYERCDTPRTSRYRSGEKSTLSLGDFITTSNIKSTKKKKQKNISSDAETLDISNSESFPEIGARKASSLKSEKRRINPTNIDSTPQKSFSMNSFNSETFQQPSPLALEDNAAFTNPNVMPMNSKETSSFEVERSILKQDRRKLMEKFNILNTSQSKISTPSIKIRKESVEVTQNFVNVDMNKVTSKDNLDILVEIYYLLIKNNYILSLGCELHFLISILLSKQCEEDFNLIEMSEVNILKSIHNSTYFAVKSLWNLRHILELIIEKSTLKVLGEHKRIRSFYPDLAKFLLNSYGLKCEQEVKEDKLTEIPNGMVCFNIETDNVDNFPTAMSFQNFRKQRDMFYEILRWYNESQQTGAAKSTFRARVKTLLSLATSPANHAHLARLFMTHMVAECLPTTQQESKLSKLQRRLIGPPTQESYRLPHFTSKELFYKEFLMFAENECFRVHLKDSLSTEICVLNATQLISTEDKANTTLADLSKDYSQLLKKLKLLSKFLGFLTELPYSQVPIDHSIKMGTCDTQKISMNYTEPKEKVLENGIALRNFSQPSIDLKSILNDAKEKGHLSITIPWIVSYLSMLDYTTLRIKYFRELLVCLFEIYIQMLRENNNKSYFKKNTRFYLKLSLGWLFDLPQFPQEFFYEMEFKSKMAAQIESIDSVLQIDESIVIEFCPFLKDLNSLLTNTRPMENAKDVCSFRHITPVSLNVNPEDRIRNKEKELQARLEAAFLKSLPSSNRRVLELVVERATSSGVRKLTKALADCRNSSRDMAAKCLSDTNPLESLRTLYTTELEKLKSKSLDIAKEAIAPCAAMALQALLAPGNTRQVLEAAAIRHSEARIERWVTTKWTGIVVLCKDLQAELESIQLQGDAETKKVSSNIDQLLLPSEVFERENVSPSAVIIELKEQICLYLDNSTASLSQVLEQCTLVTCNVFTRAPTTKALLYATVDAAVVVVSRKPKDLTLELLSKFHAIWNSIIPDRKKPNTTETPDRRHDLSPDFRNYDDRAPTPISDDEIQPINMANIVILDKNTNINANKSVDNTNKNKNIETTNKNRNKSVENSIINVNNDELLQYFDRILCPRNIMLLSDGGKVVWETMADLIVFLLANNYLSEDSLTEQCLAVYRHDWPQSVLEGLSLCMQRVSSKWASAGKFTLFLDFLSEFCGDV